MSRNKRKGNREVKKQKTADKKSKAKTKDAKRYEGTTLDIFHHRKKGSSKLIK